ncbi:5381_t:CDS:1, partial [Gigaspora margarita]
NNFNSYLFKKSVWATYEFGFCIWEIPFWKFPIANKFNSYLWKLRLKKVNSDLELGNDFWA